MTILCHTIIYVYTFLNVCFIQPKIPTLITLFQEIFVFFFLVANPHNLTITGLRFFMEWFDYI